MSTLKVNNLQVGQDGTPANNYTLYQPASPDGTVRLGYGVAGSVTDILTLKNSNLGIGTNNPSEKLQVVGRITATSAIRAGTTSPISSSAEFLSILGQATIRLDSTSYATTYLINADTTSNTIQPYLLCNDTGGNRLGLGVEYSSAIATFYGHQGISLQTGTTAFNYANERIRITSTGLVGIGTDNPGHPLDVRSSVSDSGISLGRPGQTPNFIVYNNGGQNSSRMILRHNGSNIIEFRADGAGSYINSGNFGIGTSSPSGKLHLNNNANSILGRFDSNNKRCIDLVSNDTGGHAEIRTYRNTATGTHEQTVLIDSSGSSYLNGGNVGIGTNSPDHKLQVKGDISIDNESSTAPSMLHFNAANKSNLDPTSRINFWEADAHTSNYTDSNAFIEYNGSTAGGGDGYLSIGGYVASTPNVDILTVSRSGKVGIGTIAPATKLEVRSGGTNVVSGTLFGGGFTQAITAGEPQACFISNIDNTGNSSGTEAARGGIGFSWANVNDRTRFIVGTHSNHAVRFYTNAGEKMRISADGNVGIGTIDPTTNFEVYNGNIKLGHSSGAYIGWRYSQGDNVPYNKIVNVYATGSADVGINIVGGLYTSGQSTKAIRLRVRGDGNGGTYGYDTLYVSNSRTVSVVNPGGTTTTFLANGITQMSQEKTFEFAISEASNWPTCSIGASQYAIGSFSGNSSDYYMVIEAWCHHRGYTHGGYSEYKKWVVLVGDKISSNLVEGSGNDNHLGLWNGSSSANDGFNNVSTSGTTMYLMVNPSCGARRTGRCRVRYYAEMPFTPDGSRTSSNTTTRTNQQSPFRGNAGSKPYIGNYSTTSNSANVHVSGGELYESTSSIRYKTNVEDLQSSYADNVIDNLRPVWYRSKQENTDDPANHSYFGLIAEEVAEVEPRLVNYTQFDEDYEDVPTGTYTDEDGEEQTTVERQLKADAELRPQSVQYDRLSVMLLDVIQRQKQELAALTARVAALEAGN